MAKYSNSRKNFRESRGFSGSRTFFENFPFPGKLKCGKKGNPNRHLDGEIPFSAFPNETITSELAGLLHTIPLMLNVKQESCEYQFLSHCFDRTRNRTPESTNPQADDLSTRPSDR